MLSLQSLREGRVVGPCWEKLKPKGPKGRRGSSGIARGSCLRNEAPHLDSLHLTFVRGRETGILLPNNQRQHRTSHVPKDVLPLQHVLRVNWETCFRSALRGAAPHKSTHLTFVRRCTSNVYTLDFSPPEAGPSSLCLSCSLAHTHTHTHLSTPTLSLTFSVFLAFLALSHTHTHTHTHTSTPRLYLSLSLSFLPFSLSRTHTHTHPSTPRLSLSLSHSLSLTHTLSHGLSGAEQHV